MGREEEERKRNSIEIAVLASGSGIEGGIGRWNGWVKVDVWSEGFYEIGDGEKKEKWRWMHGIGWRKE